MARVVFCKMRVALSDSKNIPTGRLGRLARLARTGASAGIGLLRGDASSSAQDAAKTLGQMRALAAKMGQMAAYVDGVVPEKHRQAYEQSMKGLLDATPASKPEDVAARFVEQLGASPEELFDHWDPTPIASASIGQVHRATTKQGVEVAVKVQHPGVEDALEQDLKNAKLLEHMMSVMGARKFDSKRMLQELKERFREELDYGLEARRQSAFARFFEDDPHIDIPEVFPELSSTRVLTTRFAHGHDFDHAMEAPEPTRAAYCEHMWRFAYKATLIGRMFNADPHPGNYKFHDDGRVTFLDFGCVQTASMERAQRALAVHRAAVQRDEQGFEDAARVLMQLDGGQWESLALDYMRHCFEPQFCGEFRLSRDYATSVLEHLRDITLQTRGAKDDHFVPLQEGMLFINRMQFGFYSILGKLDAPVDYNAIERGYVFSEPVQDLLV